MYVLLLNHFASAALDWKSPPEKCSDRSEPQTFPSFSIFHSTNPSTIMFTSDSFSIRMPNEEQGWWVGVAMQCL